MGIDKESSLGHLNIVVPDTKEVLKKLRQQAEADSQNEGLDEGEPKKLSLTNDFGSFRMEEYYFDDSLNSAEITISGEYESIEGKVWVSFSVPLSDTVLIDILQHSIKKLNKLKTALETLS